MQVSNRASLQDLDDADNPFDANHHLYGEEEQEMEESQSQPESDFESVTPEENLDDLEKLMHDAKSRVL